MPRVPSAVIQVVVDGPVVGSAGAPVVVGPVGGTTVVPGTEEVTIVVAGLVVGGSTIEVDEGIVTVSGTDELELGVLVEGIVIVSGTELLVLDVELLDVVLLDVELLDVELLDVELLDVELLDVVVDDGVHTCDRLNVRSSPMTCAVAPSSVSGPGVNT